MATRKKPATPPKTAVDGPVSDETVEVDVETLVEFVAPEVWESERPEVHVAADGDSYASIGAQWVPEGESAAEFAREIYRLNRGVVIRPGVAVRLPR